MTRYRTHSVELGSRWRWNICQARRLVVGKRHEVTSDPIHSRTRKYEEGTFGDRAGGRPNPEIRFPSLPLSGWSARRLWNWRCPKDLEKRAAGVKRGRSAWSPASWTSPSPRIATDGMARSRIRSGRLAKSRPDFRPPSGRTRKARLLQTAHGLATEQHPSWLRLRSETRGLICKENNWHRSIGQVDNFRANVCVVNAYKNACA